MEIGSVLNKRKTGKLYKNVFFTVISSNLEGVGKINPHFTQATSKITSLLGFMIAALSNIFHI